MNISLVIDLKLMLNRNNWRVNDPNSLISFNSKNYGTKLKLKKSSMSSLLNKKEPKLPALSDLKQIELDQSLL